MTDLKDTISIENVVATMAVGQELDLDQLADDLPLADFDPDRFPGLIYRTQGPKATSLIFRSGKIVATGGRSETAIRTVLKNAIDELAALGVQVAEDPSITIQNIVSSGDLGRTFNLNAIAIGLGLENIEYEPEQFPGLVYRLDQPEVVTLLFGSGKLIITGGRGAEDAKDAVDVVRGQLTELGLLD